MMEFSGEYQVPAAPETVWDALTDPEVLRACVPGCESVEKTGEWSYKASCKLRMGPVSLSMSGDLRLEDPKPPFECRIVGEGRDRAAGHAKGEATVTIAPDEDGQGGSIVRYSAKATVGGRLAQMGGRLIDAAVKKYADEFFSAFAEYLGGRRAGPQTESDAATGEERAEAKKRAIKTAWVLWGAVAVILLLLFLSGGSAE